MRLPLLDALPEEERRRVIASSRRRRFARGDTLFHEGDPANAAHLVVKGRVAVQIVTPLGQTATLDVLGPGAVLGELALLDEDGERSATARALEPTETIAVAAAELRALREQHPAIGDALLQLLADRVRQTSARLVEAMYLPADARIRRRLLDLASVYGDADPVVLPVSQEDVAGLAGTTRVTVNRVLTDEERRGTVRLGRGRIEIVDAAGLRKRSG